MITLCAYVSDSLLKKSTGRKTALYQVHLIMYRQIIIEPLIIPSDVILPNDVSMSDGLSSDGENKENVEVEENIADSIAAKTGKKEKTYKQNFRREWMNEFKWICERNGKSMCNLCNIPVAGSGFHLRRHANSSQHIKNIKAVSNTVNVKDALHGTTSLKQKTEDAEVKLVCYLCEHNLPMRLMDTLPQALATICSDSKIASNLRIERKKATKLALAKLAPFLKLKLVKQLRTRPFSIIIDETTDISIKKSLVIMVRLWDENGIADRFLDLIEVTEANAESLYKTIIGILDNNKIPYTNLAGFGSDNASVMMGVNGGVQAKLKQIAPNIMVQGCVCHSANLCAHYACLKLPNTVEQFARDIYSYFKNSSYRQEELKECQIFKEEEPHKMLRLSQTRWLSLRVSYYYLH